MMRALLLSVAALAVTAPVAAQDVAIVNAKLVIGDGSAPIEGGTVVVRGGKVVAAGAGVAVPAGIERVDAVGGTNDRSATRSRFSAGLDIAPALNPMGSPVAVNRAAGVTRAIVAPGSSSNLFAGQGAVVDLADDMDMVTRPRALQYVAFGEDGSAKAGGSRAATFLLFREQLLAARSYSRNPAVLAEWGNDAMIQRADADALVRVINGTTPLFVRVDRAVDIVNVIKLKGEFPALKLVLVGVTEGWLVARDIAAAKVPVLVSPLTDLPGSFEQLGATQSNAGRLKAAGVDVSVGVFDDDDAHKMGYTTQYAGNLVGLAKLPGASGLSWDQAFAAISSAPARAVGMDGRIVCATAMPRRRKGRCRRHTTDRHRAKRRRKEERRAVEPISLLVLTCALFVGTHFLLSHPLRAPLADRMGERPFQIVYSVVAIATFIMIIQAWRGMPAEPPMWAVGDGLWIIASLIVLFASVLFMGSLIGNPALPAPNAAFAAQGPARGVYAITRHPMMWGFALWALAHALVMPTQAQFVLSATIAFLALAGSAGQDVKKARLMGDTWRHWAARTSFTPFARQLSGRGSWGDTIPRPHALLGGIVLWGAATWAHGALGFMVAGIWRWVG